MDLKFNACNGALKPEDASKALRRSTRKRRAKTTRKPCIEIPPPPSPANPRKRKLPASSEPASSKRTRLRMESFIEFVLDNKHQLKFIPRIQPAQVIIHSSETHLFNVCMLEHGNEDINSTSPWNVFTDGSRSRGRIPRAGLGVYYTGINDAFGFAKRVAENSKFSHSSLTSTGERRVIELEHLETDALAMELLAILEAILLVESLCDHSPQQLYIYTDSLDSLQLLWEFQREPGLLTGSPHRQLLETIVSVARSSCIRSFHLHKVKAHTGIFGNEAADKLAKIGSSLPPGASSMFKFPSFAPVSLHRFTGVMAHHYTAIAAPEKDHLLNIPSNKTYPKISVRRLERRVDSGEKLLANVSFDVFPGAIVAILGPSGSGKSTLLRALNRLWEPPPETVFLDGEDVTKLDVIDVRRRVGMLFQTPCMFEGTVSDNVRYGPKLHGGILDEDEIKTLLEQSDLDDSFFDKSIHGLSVGQSQRVALARTLANRPEVLLLDEPTSALDPISTQNIEQSLMKLCRDRGLTLILVSHSVKQVQRMADVVLMLVSGQIVEILKPSELENASHPLARQFLDAT